MVKIDGRTSQLRQVRRWSSKWRWVERSHNHDDHLRRQDRLPQEKERKDVLARHGKIAMLGQNLVVKGFEKLGSDVEQGKRSLSASDASRLSDVAVKIERLSRSGSPGISESGGADERPFRVNIEDRARQAVDRALGITDRGQAERVEPEQSADVTALPDPPGE
jgi:hypothetical protein